MEKSVAYSLVKRRDFKDPEGNDRLYYALEIGRASCRERV